MSKRDDKHYIFSRISKLIWPHCQVLAHPMWLAVNSTRMVIGDPGAYLRTITPSPYFPPYSLGLGSGKSTKIYSNWFVVICFIFNLNADFLLFEKKSWLTIGIAAFATLSTVPLLSCKATAVQFMVVVIRWCLETIAKRWRSAWRLNEASMSIAHVNRVHKNTNNQNDLPIMCNFHA